MVSTLSIFTAIKHFHACVSRDWLRLQCIDTQSFSSVAFDFSYVTALNMLTDTSIWLYVI